MWIVRRTEQCIADLLGLRADRRIVDLQRSPPITIALRELLELPRLFRTPYGTEHWEATARYNIGAELDLLAA